MQNLALLFALVMGLFSCASTAQPVIPGDGVAFAGIGLQFET